MPSPTPHPLRTRLADAARRWCPRWLALYRATHLLRKEASYLHLTGYLKSLENLEPIGADGKPLPFLNYAVIELLKSRVGKNTRVFEFGSGYSTLFFARTAASVTSVEHDPGWLEKVRQRSASFDNVKLIHRPLDGSYPAAISGTGERYDLVLVDGRMRHECALQAAQCLTDSGVILWDDSTRERYQEGMAALEAGGFRRLPIGGLKPAGFGMDETTLFYRPGNCLGI